MRPPSYSAQTTDGAMSAWKSPPGYAGPAYGADSSTRSDRRSGPSRGARARSGVGSGEGMAGVIGLVRAGRFSKGDVVIWVHTGGAPGAFAYPSAMAKASSHGAVR